MKIGILGSGLMGGKLGTIFARAGHEVTFSYARGSDKLAALARGAGRNARAGTSREAAQGADLVLLALHWLRVDDVIGQAGSLSGKIVATCSLPMNRNDTALALGHATLKSPRYTEPFALLVAQLAYSDQGDPQLAYRFERM